MKSTYLNLFLLFVALSASAQTNYDTARIRPVKITEHIYMLKGAGGNIGAMIGNEGTLLIDNQFAPLSNKINGAVKTLDPREIKFMINTHLHGDHSGGNENFRRMGATLVAHDQVRERMMKESTRNNQTSPPRAKEAWPTITFADKLNFHLNDEDIVLHHFDIGHTDGDVIVQFTKANVVHTGDAFVRYGYPYIDLSSGGGVNGFINTLDKILSIKVRDNIADIRDQVAAALKKGKKVEDIAGLGITDKYDAEYGKGFVKGKDFVLMVAENLKGGK
jgi:glyoxylase-like metal-dependent hydrolase (beta-lactamase superfamily II)